MRAPASMRFLFGLMLLVGAPFCRAQTPAFAVIAAAGAPHEALAAADIAQIFLHKRN